MRKIIGVPALLGLLLVGSCNTLDVPDLNNPGLEGLRDNPTRSGVLAAATGLLIGTRANIAPFNGYVSELGVFGRESYNFNNGDPRFVSELLIGPLNGGDPRQGGNLFGTPYANIRNANILVAATAKVVGVTAQEKEAIFGFAQTIQALDFLLVINTRDANGAPIAVDINPSGSPAPVATKTEVFAHIVSLLDSADVHLNAAGGTFPFPLSNGFTGFNTPVNFLKFNRALRARVAVYTGDFTTAFTLLTSGATFIDTTTAGVDTVTGGILRTGVYNSYSTGSGDETNGLFDPSENSIFAHPSLETDVQLRVGGAKDRRFTQKLTQLTTVNPKTVHALTTTWKFNIYKSQTDPVPIIRNEELILLRAEANIALDNLGAAVADLDFIRVNSGGLLPYSGAGTSGALLDELLYNKRYSLLFEGGHRWIDVRRYNRLASDLPQDASDLGPTVRFSKMPFPANECSPRTPPPAGCAQEPGS